MNSSAIPAHLCCPETNPAETKTSGDKEIQGKLVTRKQDFFLFSFSKKLTQGGCRILRSANAEAIGNVFSM
jgi:hypothetical protein